MYDIMYAGRENSPTGRVFADRIKYPVISRIHATMTFLEWILPEDGKTMPKLVTWEVNAGSQIVPNLASVFKSFMYQGTVHKRFLHAGWVASNLRVLWNIRVQRPV